MDGIDYLNPSGICSPYERKEITSKNIEPLDFEDKGPIQTLMESVAKTQARIEDLYCLKVFCEDNINDNLEICYDKIIKEERANFKKMFFINVVKMINKELSELKGDE